MAIPPIAALEIGTTRTVALIGEIDDDQRVTITGRGVYPSTGVRKGQVVDLELAKVGVEMAVRQAADESEVNVGQLLLAVNGGHIEAVTNRGSVPVRARDHVVTREDVEEVMEIAKAVNLPPERDIMHTISQSFSLDGQSGIVKPEGMQGAQLALDMLVIHAVRNRIDNVRNVVQRVQLDVQDVTFGGLCAALAVLTPEQKRNGVAVIDLGGGTTSFLAYADNVMAAAGSLGIGGDHVTNDLALAFNIPIARAEELKRREGCALVSAGIGLKRLAMPQEVGFPERSISLKAFHVVINARIEETLRMVRGALHDAGVLTKLSAGIVLTGGGAYLKRLPELAQNVFGLPCMIGEPINVAGLREVEDGAAYATTAGLTLYGFRTYRESSLLQPLREWWQGVFRR
ncbi:MAG: cell division protein FtsA [Kiritimatiellae bacterium]|nr:cell division protein FtsA [Kiritimatiellia bacterium]